MISQALFHILETDTTDITTAAAIAKQKAADSNFVDASLALYHYQSLKTLLKESTNNVTDSSGNPSWLEKHVKLYEKNYNVENVLVDKTDKPLIAVCLADSKDVNYQSSGECNIFIDVLTDANIDASDLAYNISNRIQSIFLYNPAYSCTSTRSFANLIPGLKLIQFEFMGESIQRWDYIRSRYKVRYSFYGRVNDA